VLLVDNKFDVDQDNIMKLIRTVTDKPIVYVVNTHFHGDHTGGNSAMQKMHASVFAHQTAREKMIDAGMPGLPDVTLEDTLNIHLGGKTIELHYLGRGHTDGDVVAYFPDYRLLSAGDLFTYGDATPQLIDYSGGGSAKSWTTTLDRILKLDFETVIPGHGDVTTKAEMKKFRNNTVMLRQRVSELLKAEASREEMIAMLKSEFHYVDFLLNISLDGLMVELR
jgi:glyoxylase-like metal-dependent hydrolase (beta-lactamase superfamily II)